MIPLLPLLFAAGAVVVIRKNAEDKALARRRRAEDNDCEMYNNVEIDEGVHDVVDRPWQLLESSEQFDPIPGSSIEYAKSALSVYVPERCTENPGVTLRFRRPDGKYVAMPAPMVLASIADLVIDETSSGTRQENDIVNDWLRRVAPRLAAKHLPADEMLYTMGYLPDRGSGYSCAAFQKEWNFFVTEMMAPTSGYKTLEPDGIAGPKTIASMKLALRSPSSLMTDAGEIHVRNFSDMVRKFYDYSKSGPVRFT